MAATATVRPLAATKHRVAVNAVPVRQEALDIPEVSLNTNIKPTVAAAVHDVADEANPYALPLHYAYTPRKIRVITIGAGFSGLLMAHKFQHRFPEMDDIVEHKIFEALHDVGGTWLLNTYPGVQCDVPAHIYVSSESPRAWPLHGSSR
jgi:hypothetical protein